MDQNKSIYCFFLLLALFATFTTRSDATGTEVRKKIVSYAQSMIGEHFLGGKWGEISTVDVLSNFVSYHNETIDCLGNVNRRGVTETCLDHWHFDCSGLLSRSIKEAGIYLNYRTTALRLFFDYGDYVSTSEVLPGDLCFLENTYQANVTHSSIYVGDGAVISSYTTGGGVFSLSLYNWMYNPPSGNFAGCRRIITRLWPDDDRSYDGSRPYDPDFLQITCGEENARAGPNYSQRSWGSVHEGEQYTVRNVYNDWAKIDFDDEHAWVPMNCAQLITPRPYIVTNVTYASVYSGPSYATTQIGHSHYNQRWVWLDSTIYYYKIYFDGEIGYISQRSTYYVDPADPGYTTTTTTTTTTAAPTTTTATTSTTSTTTTTTTTTSTPAPTTTSTTTTTSPAPTTVHTDPTIPQTTVPLTTQPVASTEPTEFRTLPTIVPTIPDITMPPDADSLIIFDGTVVEPFTEYSWISKENYGISTECYHSEPQSYWWTPNEAEGLYFSCDDCSSLSDYHGLSLWLHGGSEGGQQLMIGWRTNASIDYRLLRNSYIEANEWTNFFVPFSDVPSTESLVGVEVVAASYSQQPTLYIDDISFIKYDTDTVTPEPTTSDANLLNCWNAALAILLMVSLLLT